MAKVHPYVTMCILLVAILKLTSGDPPKLNLSKTVQNCGEKLVATLNLYCSLFGVRRSHYGGKRSNRFEMNDLGDYNSPDSIDEIHSKMDSIDNNVPVMPPCQNSYECETYTRWRRYPQDTGLSNECCLRPCSRATLLSYCP